MASGTSDSVSNHERNTTYFRKEIRKEWKALWDQRIEDKQIAEDVARRDYDLLFVETGTVIRASRLFKPLDLEEIIDENERLLGLNLHELKSDEGGYRKFAKNILSKQSKGGRAHLRRYELSAKNVRNCPPKNAGRGWLHSQ